MSNLEQQTIDKLFRDLIRVYSTSATSMIGLDSIKMAITELVCEEGGLADEINKLSDSIKNTQPRMFPLDNLMLILDGEVQSLSDANQLKKKTIIKLIDDFKLGLDSDLDELTQKSLEWIDDGDFIVIHSIEETIENLIPEAKLKGKDFKILVLKQDIITTGKILKILGENNIEFEVIPEYDLVHYFGELTKLFLGTQALTNDQHIVCDPGTSNIVSECHIHKVPICLFLKTLKFSHYPASDQNIHKNSYKDEHKGVKYRYSIHSNDIIKLNLIDHIITEKGEVSLNDIPAIREKVIA